MQEQSTELDRRQEIVDTLLKQFISKGLYETTARDLGDALKMQKGGLYYHFRSKDDMVVICAEEAGRRLEDGLILPSFDCVENPELMMEQIKERSDEYAPMMRFFTQVCSSKRYYERMKPALNRMQEHHERYAEKVAERLNCSVTMIAPYLYLSVIATSDYMLFGQDRYCEQSLEVMKKAIAGIQEEQL